MALDRFTLDRFVSFRDDDLLLVELYFTGVVNTYLITARVSQNRKIVFFTSVNNFLS